ncbi:MULTISPECIES: aldose 1-epimerase family protein [Sphingobacterium]|uniref:aldose 1-epimerase family protein n=1 Tax=Sphingobacterium TaxID=28453 RepID=UPI00257EF8D3|nr:MULTISPECIES: aldose 1-epimerase family protein [Sphingobacterium]
MVEISSDFLKVKIALNGAELRSVYSLSQRREYLWQADSRYWGRSSPILFPFVGAMRDNQYQYKGQFYHITKHGFARDSMFNLIDKSEDSVLLSLSTNEETFKSYPFDFELYLSYKICADILSCSYLVKNIGAKMMFFSIGAHPAFKLDFSGGTQWSDYRVSFEQDDSLERYYLVNDLLSLRGKKIQLVQNQLHLSVDMFDDDVWVLKHLTSKKIKLFSEKNNYIVEMRCNDFTHFGLWGAKKAPFICLEPWFGVNDSCNFRGTLEDKEGIIKLLPDNSWEGSWEIHIRDGFNLA